ncbi:MAG: hypothetical protein HC908_01495 [Calothrix sp. SM1_7_51]|nr:hypothetical protein [Calothrix sp. SM1_7_51]
MKSPALMWSLAKRYAVSTKEQAFGYVSEQFFNTHVQVQVELEQYLEQQALEIAPEFEIDSDKDSEFGELFRVWQGNEFIGSFYRSLDGSWVAQPAQGVFSPRLQSDEQAQLVLIAFCYGRQSV